MRRATIVVVCPLTLLALLVVLVLNNRPIRPRRRDVPVVAFGSGATLLGLIRTLHRAGVPAYGATQEGDLARRSRFFRELSVPPPADASRGQFEAFLDRLPLPEAVLMACSDTAAMHVAALDARLRERFHTCTSAPEVLELFVDKLRFAEVARAADVRIPFTLAIEGEQLPDRGLFEGSSRYFLKPRDSVAFVTDYGIKAMWVSTWDELCRRLERVRARGHRMILQEYVPGPPSNHYFIDGFVDAGGNVAAKLARRRIRMFPVDFGNSTYMTTVERSAVPEACDAIDRLVAHTGYRGVFSAELKRDERDGRFRVVEVNVRPWLYVDFAARCGVDVCSMAYRDALGEPVAAVERYEIGRSAVSPQLDWLAGRELRRQGSMTAPALLRSWWGADQPVFDWRDPMPSVHDGWWSGKRFLGSRCRRLLGGAPATAT